MNPLSAAATAASWRADRAWSLPLIVATMVGLATAFLLSMTQEAWITGRDRRHPH